jgi:predicted TIM-barrel fold metal-dependent hydrolase
MIPRWRRSWADPTEDLPVDVLPCSNGEYVPLPATAEQHRIMGLADAESERWRRRLGMSRRQFVRTAAATAIGFWAIDMIGDTRFGSYGFAHNTATTDACDLEWAGRGGLETLSNLPGEFIFDIQSHHVDPEGLWRVNNPAIHAFFAAVWPQAGPLGGEPGVRDDGSIRGFGAGEVDPIANLSRFHYLKELFLDSATTMTVLSAVPTAPDTQQPLPIAEAAETVETVNRLAGSQRSVMHAFVMPNRGSAGTNTDGMGLKPVFLQEELDLMTERAVRYRGILRGWKVYCPWGDVPGASGWFLDSPEIGLPFLAHVQALSNELGTPPVVATHKGFALPGFDQRAAATRDVGPAAAAFPGLRFIVYHSGHDTGEGAQGPYQGPDAHPAEERSVDAFIANLQRSGMDAQSHGGNSPNVYAELGSVWRDYMGDPSSAAHLLGKLITHVGPQRVVWGTDSLWYGSPQAEIVALRRFEFSDEAKAMYNLPFGLEGDVRNPRRKAKSPKLSLRNAILGRNAARAYGIDPDAARHAIGCDDVNAIREEYLTNPNTPRESAPMASNQVLGARTRRELFASLKEKPWSP